MDKKPKSRAGRYWFVLLMGGVCIALIVAMTILMVTTPKATPLENGLMTFILTAASCVISYLVSKFFAEQSFDQVLRDHGVQIARGIMELKTQIGSLSDWVGAKRSLLNSNSQSMDSADSALEHVELTLQAFKGLSDNAVGGIAGVIGDAYDQYEDFIQQVGRVRSEAQVETFEIEKEMESAVSPMAMAKLQERINEIALQTERKISRLAKTASLPIPPTPATRLFSTQCPMCSGVTSFEMVERAGETKPILCKNCGGRFNAHLSAAQEIFTRAISGPRVTAHITQPVVSSESWDNPQDVQGEARNLLQKTQAFVDPNFLREILQLVVRHDRELRRVQPNPSPWALQASVLADQNKKISHVGVRAFFKMIFLGDGFEFEVESKKTFKTPYTNALLEIELEKAFVRGSFGRLSKLRPISLENSGDLAAVLFGDSAMKRQDLVDEVLRENA